MALKDASQLVKMYAMVNVQQYDAVATGTTVEECVDNYVQLLADRGITTTTPVDPGDTETVSGVVADVRYAVVDGGTVCYIRLEGEEAYYTISAAEAPEAVILNPGDEVTIGLGSADTDSLLIPAGSLTVDSRAPLDEPEPTPEPDPSPSQSPEDAA